MDSIFIRGSTIRSRATFKDFDGNIVDPEIVKVKVYDLRHQLIQEVLPNRVGLGSYHFNYDLPDGDKRLIYEWYCEIGGAIGIERNRIRTVFIKEGD